MLNHHPKLKKAHNKAKWRKTYKNVPDIFSLDMRYKESKKYIKEFEEYVLETVKNTNHLDELKAIDNLIKMI